VSYGKVLVCIPVQDLSDFQMSCLSVKMVLGGFHSLSCFLSSIGKLWADDGLRDLLVDSGVYDGQRQINKYKRNQSIVNVN
jgi:hypothetical protein